MKRIALLSASLLACAVSWSQLRVSDLRVEHVVNPTQVDVAAPRLSWVNNPVDEKARGLRQTAYQIVVATSPENLQDGKYDAWNSGKCNSCNSLYISYAGKALKSGEDYYWQVRTWDNQGRPSEWSQVNHWGMGFLKASDWKAQWIKPAKTPAATAPLLRKGFEIGKAVKKAKAFVCGLGLFELYVNGQRIGNDCLVPNLTNYSKRPGLEKEGIALPDNFTDYRVLYLSYDITKNIQAGNNALGVVLGNGYYHSDYIRGSVFGELCLICQVEITYEDGSRQTIVSDPSWKTKPSAIVYNGIHGGETYDARKETASWCSADCDESKWENAQAAEAPVGKLTAQTSPGDKVMEILYPQTLTKLSDGSFEVDFGTEIAGWIRFKNIKGRAGDTLHVKFVSESPQGMAHYIFKGDKKENYAPRFTWFAFSKAIITGVKELRPENLQAEAVNTEVPLNSEFVTSNELFNKINTIWQRSQMDNMHCCVASDCPHRERLPYTGDGEAAAAMVMLNFDAAPFYQKWVRDMRDSQDKTTGYVPNGAPWHPSCGGGVAWGAAMNIIPWDFYLHYGDKKMLADCYQPMKDQVRHMMTWLTEDGIMFQKKCNVGSDKPNYWFNLGDWCSPTHLPKGEPQGLPKEELVHTFYLYLCASITAQTARVLGKKTEQVYYEQVAKKVNDAFHRYFYDANNKTYGDFGSNIFALQMNMPADRKADVVNSLKKEIVETHRGHVNTGFLAGKYFYETLSNNGLHQVAYDAMNKKDFPSIGYWISKGATTTWEEWDGANSHNHPMQGSGLTWFSRHLAGVNVDANEPGYKHIVIRPFLTKELTKVRYAHQTPYGQVLSQIVKKDGKTQMTVTIPVGSWATVYVPSAIDQITESGETLKTGKYIQVAKNDNTETSLNLQQGTYVFEF